MKLRLGIHIGPQNISMADLRRLWRFADEHLDWISVWDHFYEAPYVNGESPHFEAVAMMAAIATDTRRVRIGNMVFCMLYRNPGLLAKSLVTLDHLGNGRLEVGRGAGWHEAEFAAYGYAFPPIKQRLDMLEEGTEVLKSLLAQPRTEHHGAYYQMNNAALYHSIRLDSQLEVDIEYWRKMFAVNVEGVLLCTQAFAPMMIGQNYGRIINQASVGAYLGGGGAYAVSKVALLGITQGFARELGRHGITVNAIAPGLVFTEATLATVSEAAQEAMVTRAAVPVQGQPRDLTSALLFFASEDSRWVTGQTLIVDGGLSARL